MTEADFIRAINEDAASDPERKNRLTEYVYADWLDEQGDPRGEAWRVLLEDGKRPQRRGIDWEWFPGNPTQWDGHWGGLYPWATFSDDFYELLEYDATYPSYFAAMNAAAIAWVRFHRDPDFAESCHT